MSTSWIEEEVSQNYEAYNDTLEQILGYPFVYNWLPFTSEESKVILDYGCGPGKVAARFVEMSGQNIIAVDESAAALAIARKKRCDPRIVYLEVQKDDLKEIKDNSLDGAFLCFVILNIATKQKIERILNNIYTKLKPGAPCIILDVNPDAIGIKFSTFQMGRKGRQYQDGESREAWLHISMNQVLKLEGHYWSKASYASFLLDNGYGKLEFYTPTLKNASKNALEIYRQQLGVPENASEWDYPPFLLLKGKK